MLASRIDIEIGFGYPERERFALVHGLLFGASMALVVPLVGRLFAQSTIWWPGLARVAPFVLAAIANYLIVEDVRSGHVFDTEHALPEIFVPVAVVLLVSARLGLHIAQPAAARHAWLWFSGILVAAVLALVAMVAIKAATDSGDFELDSPTNMLALAVIAIYAVAGPLDQRRHPASMPDPPC